MLGSFLKSLNVSQPEGGASEMSSQPSFEAQPDSRPGNATPRSLYGYEVIDFLGEGAGSMIYAASDPITHQLYAIKHVAVKVEKDQRFIEQLINEYEVGQKVQHPALRRCIDLKLTKTLLRKITDAALVMEMVEGTSCEARPPTDMTLLIDIFHQTATALAALHAQNYVHCDLKPNNILVSTDKKVKIIDFGQACPIGSVKKRIQGTPDFIAPEQVPLRARDRSDRCLQPRRDLLLASQRGQASHIVHLEKIPQQFPRRRCDQSPRSELKSKVPENLSNLVMDCCRITPAKPPPTCPNSAAASRSSNTPSPARPPLPACWPNRQEKDALFASDMWSALQTPLTFNTLR